jgi:hypothetical protein
LLLSNFEAFVPTRFDVFSFLAIIIFLSPVYSYSAKLIISLIDHNLSVTFASIAGVTLNV